MSDTTITERGLAHEWFHDCKYVNPDAIAQDELGDWNDADRTPRSKTRDGATRGLLARGPKLGVRNGVLCADKPEFVRRALAVGYLVRIFFVGTAGPEINAARVARRVLQLTNRRWS